MSSATASYCPTRRTPPTPLRTRWSTASSALSLCHEGARMAASSTNLVGTEPLEGAYTSTQHLVQLEGSARDMSFVAKKPVQQMLAGRLASRIRGRGLIFEEVREYLPGDDIRSID